MKASLEDFRPLQYSRNEEVKIIWKLYLFGICNSEQFFFTHKYFNNLSQQSIISLNIIAIIVLSYCVLPSPGCGALLNGSFWGFSTVRGFIYTRSFWGLTMNSEQSFQMRCSSKLSPPSKKCELPKIMHCHPRHDGNTTVTSHQLIIGTI